VSASLVVGRHETRHAALKSARSIRTLQRQAVHGRNSYQPEAVLVLGRLGVNATDRITVRQDPLLHEWVVEAHERQRMDAQD
jgi:hypothetical protein